MKSYALPLSVLATVLLAGCSTTPQDSSAQSDSSEPYVQEFLMHGQVSKTEQGYTFSPCNSSDDIPLILSNDKSINKINQAIEDNIEKANGDNGYAASLYAHIEQPMPQESMENSDISAEDGIDEAVETAPITTAGLDEVHLVSSKIESIRIAPKMTCQQISEPQTEADEAYVGQYQSQTAAASSPGLTTTLALNPDHSATAVYDYQNNEPSVIETGYWQAYSDGRVNLVMTKHNDRSLISVRTFTLSDDTLSTSEESINGQVYSLGTQGMNLSRIERDETQELAPVTPETEQMLEEDEEMMEQLEE